MMIVSLLIDTHLYRREVQKMAFTTTMSRDPFFSRFASMVHDMHRELSFMSSMFDSLWTRELKGPRRLMGSQTPTTPNTPTYNTEDEIGMYFPRSRMMMSMDMKQDNDRYTIRMDVPGMTSQDLKVTLEEGHVLSVSGERKSYSTTSEDASSSEEETQSKDIIISPYLYRERYHGKFTRSVVIPQDIDLNGIDASVHNGILTVIIPRKPNHENKSQSVLVK